MAADRHPILSQSGEQEFAERIAVHYAPTPLTSAQRQAFDRALVERLTRRTPLSFVRPFPVFAATAAAFLVWLATSSFYSHTPTEIVSSSSPAVTSVEITPLEKEENLLIYAYYSSDFDEDETEDESESFLPDEYEAFDSALLFPGA